LRAGVAHLCPGINEFGIHCNSSGSNVAGSGDGFRRKRPRRSTLSWCRRTRISACNAARDRNSPTTAHQINLQRSSIAIDYYRFAGNRQAYRVCGRDRGPEPTDDEKQAIFDTFADAIARRLLVLAAQRVWKERGREWRSAYDKQGKGSTFVRADIIGTRILEPAAPIPDLTLRSTKINFCGRWQIA
jgi:hypothetical protein